MGSREMSSSPLSSGRERRSGGGRFRAEIGMDSPVSVERSSWRERRSGCSRFRAEIEMDRGHAISRSPEFGFAAAVREPLVRLQRPKYDFERWDWEYFAWPHDRLDANLEMRDSDPSATFEADCKEVECFLSRSTLQLEKLEELEQQAIAERKDSNGFPSRSMLQLPKLEMWTEHQAIDGEPVGCGAPWRHGCAESCTMLEHGKAVQGPCAY